MIDEAAAKKLVKAYVPGATIEACVPYKSNFLLRVAYAAKNERNFDPFYLVNSESGAVEEFSVITDGNLDEIAEAFGVTL